MSFVHIGFCGEPIQEQEMFWKHMQQPDSVKEEKQPSPPSQVPDWQPPPSHGWNWGLQLSVTQVGHPGGGDCANAGVLMLVRTGAVQAMAAPAPIRFSILRREMPSFGSSSSEDMNHPLLLSRRFPLIVSLLGASRESITPVPYLSLLSVRIFSTLKGDPARGGHEESRSRNPGSGSIFELTGLDYRPADL